MRLPGSGGGSDIVSSARRIIMTHEKRKIVKKFDYLHPFRGYLQGCAASPLTASSSLKKLNA
jgi:acyl CoA:acetate/3-ketoacid CoA transferase beta subunit